MISWVEVSTRREPLLALEGLDGKAHSKHRRGAILPVAALAPAPAAGHPVVPHEDTAASSVRASRPPTSRYSRLKQQAIARSGMICDHSSNPAFMIFS